MLIKRLLRAQELTVTWSSKSDERFATLMPVGKLGNPSTWGFLLYNRPLSELYPLQQYSTLHEKIVLSKNRMLKMGLIAGFL